MQGFTTNILFSIETKAQVLYISSDMYFSSGPLVTPYPYPLWPPSQKVCPSLLQPQSVETESVTPRWARSSYILLFPLLCFYSCLFLMSVFWVSLIAFLRSHLLVIACPHPHVFPPASQSAAVLNCPPLGLPCPAWKHSSGFPLSSDFD